VTVCSCRAKAAARHGGTRMEETTRKALNETISKDGNTSTGRRGWEQFDLNKMNYEQETKGALPF
jgi:hypothetical protein